MAAFGWGNTMNECACNSASLRNGKDSLLYRSCRFLSGGEYGSGDPGSGCIVDSRRTTLLFYFIFLEGGGGVFLATVVWLMIMVDSATHLLANRAITINQEDHLTLEAD